MSHYEVHIEGNTLARLRDSFARAPQIAGPRIAKGLNQAAVGYQSTARQLAPIDKGPLRAGIQVVPAQIRGNVITASVEATAPHSLWQEQGTGVYGPSGQPIRPKRARVLAWKTGSTWHFAKQVRGVKPRWFMRGSVERNQRRTDDILAATADEIVELLAGGR